MKKLLELEAKLKKAKEELEKQSLLGSMNPVTPMDASPASGADVNKECGIEKKDVETCGKMDSKKDQKIIAEALDDHNENKHGEAKDVDSAKKSDIPKEITDQPTSDIVGEAGDKGPLEAPKKLVKFYKNGQWSMD